MVEVGLTDSEKKFAAQLQNKTGKKQLVTVMNAF